MHDQHFNDFRHSIPSVFNQIRDAVIHQVNKVTYSDKEEWLTKRGELLHKKYGNKNYSPADHDEWKIMYEHIRESGLTHPQRKFSGPIDYSPAVAQGTWKLVCELIYQITPIYEESYLNYRQYGKDVSDRYNEQVLRVVRRALDFLNDAIGMDNQEYLDRLNELDEQDFEVMPYDSGEIVSLLAQAIELNKMHLHLSAKLYSYYPEANRPDISSVPLYNNENATLKVLLIYHTGIYDNLLHQYKNKTTVSKIIGAIVNSMPATVARIFPFFAKPKSADKNNPYKNQETVASLINKLSELKIDTTPIEAIQKNLLSQAKNNGIKK